MIFNSQVAKRRRKTMKYQAICFDFDYTLADASDGIVAGFQYALPRLGWPIPTREEVTPTIGLLLEDAYVQLTGDTDQTRIARFRPLFREVAEERQRTDTRLFPGAERLLRELHGQGIKLGIVSTKNSETIHAVLQHYSLDRAADVIVGYNHVEKPKPDPQGIDIALQALGAQRDAFLFCGDTVLDAGAAHNAGVDFAAVLNGTTRSEAFTPWPHVLIAKDLPELGDFLKNAR